LRGGILGVDEASVQLFLPIAEILAGISNQVEALGAEAGLLVIKALSGALGPGGGLRHVRGPEGADQSPARAQLGRPGAGAGAVCVVVGQLALGSAPDSLRSRRPRDRKIRPLWAEPRRIGGLGGNGNAPIYPLLKFSVDSPAKR
jgi:hypothetical protein